MTPSYLLNHYDVEETEYGYSFITDSGITYFLTFIAYPAVSDFLATNIYMFNIDRGNGVCNGQDDVRIRETVVYVLEQFFKHHEDALITICDVNDGKQCARKRLFDRWFEKYNNGNIIRVDETCVVEDIQTFVSLMFSAKHYDKENLTQEFSKLAEINFYN